MKNALQITGLVLLVLFGLSDLVQTLAGTLPSTHGEPGQVLGQIIAQVGMLVAGVWAAWRLHVRFRAVPTVTAVAMQQATEQHAGPAGPARFVEPPHAGR